MHLRMRWLWMPLLMVNVSAAAQPAPVIDNDRVTVWDVLLDHSASSPPTSQDEDTVILFLEGGTIRTTMAGGKTSVATRQFGDAVFVPKGSGATDSLVSGGPAHEVVVALKNHPAPPIANVSGYPLAFPRPGAVKTMDNDRVVVWHYSWIAGVPTPMHFHDKDVVLAYRYDGSIKSVTPDGTATVNASKKGDIRFNKGNRAHFEELVSGHQSAVIMELK